MNQPLLNSIFTCQNQTYHSTNDIQQGTRNRIVLHLCMLFASHLTPSLQTHDFWFHIGVLLHPAHVLLNLFGAS